jgi:hypothetical protein
VTRLPHPPDPAARRKPRYRSVTSISGGASSALLGAEKRDRRRTPSTSGRLYGVES